ncbi:hypothetical protein HZH68_004296 [Vespula germanica]|uniref:Uncharacterized protein n=1 Tax=Vespula germanica TaxID=30212 RepID=A0A834KNJ9_VESGE|nr:hypothetical protein HZH68_004296 [Vespula germanica]
MKEEEEEGEEEEEEVDKEEEECVGEKESYGCDDHHHRSGTYSIARTVHIRCVKSNADRQFSDISYCCVLSCLCLHLCLLLGVTVDECRGRRGGGGGGGGDGGGGGGGGDDDGDGSGGGSSGGSGGGINRSRVKIDGLRRNVFRQHGETAGTVCPRISAATSAAVETAERVSPCNQRRFVKAIYSLVCKQARCSFVRACVSPIDALGFYRDESHVLAVEFSVPV